MGDAFQTDTLSEHFQEQLRGRRVEAAVFTTYTFEPGFFELQVLPCLFDRKFSDVDRVRAVQLEEELRRCGDIAVYYDRSALLAATPSAGLDYHRLPVARRTGAFHPKVALLLLRNVSRKGEEEGLSLLVGVMSANLTRAGWWENLECAHFEEIADGEKSTLRDDLRDFLKVVRAEEHTGRGQETLDKVDAFLRHRVEPSGHGFKAGHLKPRLFYGQQPLGEFLNRLLAPEPGAFNLEIISPYFEPQEPWALRNLQGHLFPRETRVLLPLDLEGRVGCSERLYDTLRAIGRTSWATAPAGKPFSGNTDEGARRFVHAKVYRLWEEPAGREVLVVGSANLTKAGLTEHGQGNLEASFVFGQRLRYPRFWLSKRSAERPAVFAPSREEDEAPKGEYLDLSIRFDWASRKGQYFLEGEAPRLLVLRAQGVAVQELAGPVAGAWTWLSPDACAVLEARLRSSCYLEASTQRGPDAPRFTVMVSEDGMAQKPSVLASFTAEEILRYWSLLSDDQREALLLTKVPLRGDAEAEALARAQGGRSAAAPASMFDGFAATFHAFGRLKGHVDQALSSGDVREAEYRLLGEKHDSLPCLLRRVLDDPSSDPVLAYVTVLSAYQALRQLRAGHPEFFQARREDARRLEALLERRGEVRARLGASADAEGQRFLDWFEQRFLTEARGGAEC